MNKLKRTLLIIGTIVLIGCNPQLETRFELRGKTLEVYQNRHTFSTVIEIDSIVYTIESRMVVSAVGREFKCNFNRRLLRDLEHGTLLGREFIQNCKHES